MPFRKENIEVTPVTILTDAFVEGFFKSAEQYTQTMKKMGEKISAELIDKTLLEVLDAEIKNGQITTVEELETRISELTK